MPLTIDCNCGTKLRVADEYVGRQVKCPSCGGISVATPASPVKTAPTPPLPAPTTPPDLLRFACACGQPLQARAEHAGRSVRCPVCQAAVIVPGAREAVRTAPPPLPPAVSSPPPMPPAFARGHPPAAPAGRRALWPFVVGGAAILLLIGGVVLAMFLMRGGGSTADLAYVPANAQGFYSIRVADLWNHAAVQKALEKVKGDIGPDPAGRIEEFLGISPTDVERVTAVVSDVENQEFWLIVSTSKAIDQKKLRDRIEKLGPIKFVETKIDGKPCLVNDLKGGPDMVWHFASDRILVVAPTHGAMEACFAKAAQGGSGPLTPALRVAAQRHHLVAGLNPAQWASQFKQQLEFFGPQAEGFKVLLDFTSATAIADLSGTTSEGEITISFPGDDKAREAHTAVKALKTLVQMNLRLVRGQIGDPVQLRVLDQIEKELPKLVIEQRGREVVIRSTTDIGDQIDTAVAQLVNELENVGGPGLLVGDAADRAVSANNLKELALAMHSYHNDHQACPPAVKRDATGKPLWSWRVELLPYLGPEEAERYQHLKQDEPWDGPNNSKVLAKMPKVFQMPGKPEDGRTHYQVFGGPGAAFNRFPNERTGPRLAQIADGTSNTIMIAEAARSVSWAAPEDLAVNFPQPDPRITFDPALLGANPGQPFQVVMFDGVVKRVKRTVNPTHLAYAITPFGGEIQPDNWEGR